MVLKSFFKANNFLKFFIICAFIQAGFYSAVQENRTYDIYLDNLKNPGEIPSYL